MLLNVAIALSGGGLKVRRKLTAVSSHKKCLPGVHDALHHRKKAKSTDGEKSTRTLEAGSVGENEHLDATYQTCTFLDDAHRTTLASNQAQVPES